MARMAPRVLVRRADQAGPVGSDPRRALLLHLYRTALRRVDGRHVVARTLRAQVPVDTAVIALGKAAAAMMAGAQEVLGAHCVCGFVVTAPGYERHLTPLARVAVHVGDHPVPGPASLAAGEALEAFIAALPADLPVLVLVSGGASSLVERLLPGVTAADLVQLNQWAHGIDLPIGALNALRRRFSALKDGRLASRLAGRPAQAFVLSDVPDDDPAVVGSGLVAVLPSPPLQLPAGLPAALVQRLGEITAPLGATLPVTLVGCLREALDAVEVVARGLGCTVERQLARIDGPAGLAGTFFARRLLACAAEVLIGGGETTVRLPPSPGVGGRSQHFALSAALGLEGDPVCALLAAGTDGADGASEDAGAMVDGGTCARATLEGQDPAACLRAADSGRCLEASGDLVYTGPTSTNVGDIVIGLKMQDVRLERLSV